jgi:hypothetical protein
MAPREGAPGGDPRADSPDASAQRRKVRGHQFGTDHRASEVPDLVAIRVAVSRVAEQGPCAQQHRDAPFERGRGDELDIGLVDR